MTAAPMRHFNSPAELAKREAGPEGDVPHRGFRHWNHPDEIAKRERDGVIAKAIVVPSSRPRRVVDAVAEQWPPPGQENTASVVVAPGGTAPTRARPLNAPADSRLAHVEECLYALVDTPSEAREFRMHLSNTAAVVDSQRDLIQRVRAAEQTLEQVLLLLNAQHAHDTQLLPPDHEEPAPGEPPTVPDVVVPNPESD